MKWLIIFLPLNLFGGWSSDWDALEDYVNGAADHPPRFVTTNLVYELQLAMLERAHSINVTASYITNLVPLVRFNTDNDISSPKRGSALLQIDDFLRQHGHRFAPDTWIDGSGQPTAEMLEYCTFEDFDGYDATAFLLCPTNTVQITIPGWRGPNPWFPGFSSGNILRGGDKPGGITKIWETAEGYPDKLALWKFQNTDEPEYRDYLESVWSFIENPGFSGGLLGECIYTVTNVYTSGDDIHYQVGWKYSKHDSFHKLFRTNDWTGADSLVRAKLSVPTGTLPSVSFTVEGFAINTDDWFTYENQTESTRGGTLRHMSPTTNTFSVGGAGVTTYTLPVYMDLTGFACASTIDTTNIASVANLGATLAVDWFGSKPSYSVGIWGNAYETQIRFERPARGSVFANVHALVCRKWILQAMDLAIGYNSTLTTNRVTTSAWTALDPPGQPGNRDQTYWTNSYAAAQAMYGGKSYTNLVAGRRLSHLIEASFNCLDYNQPWGPPAESYGIVGDERGVIVQVDGDSVFGASGAGHVLNPIYSNLTANAMYVIAIDISGYSLTHWENPTPNVVRDTYFTIATATDVGEGHVFYFEPGYISFPPTPSWALAGPYTGEIGGTAFSYRGYEVEVLDEMLIDWGYEYD